MPTSVLQLTSVFNVEVIKSVKWGTRFDERNYGIYIVSTSQNIEYLPKITSPISIDKSIVSLWQQNASEMLLNGKKVTTDILINHLKMFWIEDESILYIGKAEKQFLSRRVNQFYLHEVGKKSPHKGGYWVKLLNNLDNYYIHLIRTDLSHEVEEMMLQYFMENVSNESKTNLMDKKLCLPFANLQLRSGVVKKHGFSNHYQ